MSRLAAACRSLVADARREPVTAALFAAAMVATLLPIWIGRYLPLLDYPNHLSVTFVWRHLHEPWWDFDRYYTTHLVPLPYWVGYGAVYAMSLVVGTAVAQKLFLTLAIALLPLTVALYARAMGRDPRLAIFAFPLAWNYNVGFGFISYAAGLPALFFSLWLLDRFATAPSVKRGLVAAAAGASLYFFHILTWGTWLLVGGVVALATPRPWRPLRALVAPLPTLPAAALGLWAYLTSRTMDVKTIPNTGNGLAGYQFVFYEPSGVLKNLPDWLLNLFTDSRDEWFAVGLALVWLLLLTTRALVPAGASDDDPDRGSARAWRVELASAVAIVLLFKLPRTIHQPFYWYAINSRLAVLVALLAALWVRGPLVGARRALWVGAALLSIGFGADVAAHYRRFNQRAHGFDVVMEGVPHGARVLPLMMTLGDRELNVNCYNQWGSYVQLHTGGFVPWNNDISFPLRQLDRLAAPPWNHPEMFSFAAYGSQWDYFLIHGPTTGDPFARAHDKVRLAAQSGDWQLWQKLANP